MNMTFTIAMLICMFLLMFTIPFLVFMGLGSALGTQPDEIRVLISYFLFAGIVVFLASLGVFVLMQKEEQRQLLVAITQSRLVWLVLFVRRLVWRLVHQGHLEAE